MDFASYALCDGCRISALTAVEIFTRECLASEADKGIKGEQVVGVLVALRHQRGVPQAIRAANGPEFVRRMFDHWAYQNASRPRKPTDNAYAESFNGRFRDECLNANWFLSLSDARRKIAAWR
jgi:putative transposase